MICQVILRRFMRFEEVTFDIPGHIVLAGPNNTGKTTVLQAIAAWCLALERWRQLNDFQKHNGVYAKAPIARQAFAAVPLRSFDLLWNERNYQRNSNPIEIEIQGEAGWQVPLEFITDSTEQIYVRPKRDVSVDLLRRRALFEAVYVPPMTGLSTDEPVYQAPKIRQLLGQGKPGDVIRNLLVEAHQSPAWDALASSIQRLFGYILLPPDFGGADIIAEYQPEPNRRRLASASAGSGFQQVLMLLTFLHARLASVLLIDEPDAHLHVILQDAIYGELCAVAARQNSQLIVATHSEVIIDSVEPRELCVLLDNPRQIADEAERNRLSKAIGILQNTDLMLARVADGVLYVEGHTDIAILREWAKILNHPAKETLTTRLFWKPTVESLCIGGSGIKAQAHHEALQFVRADFPGLIILDGDNDPRITDTQINGQGLQRTRWRRYEIESYLVHPAALQRYVTHYVGEEAAQPYIEDLQRYFEDNFPPAFLRDPLGDYPFLKGTKARAEILPPALAAAGLHGIPYTSYDEIAALMRPEEIHPEVIEKLDAIQRAFGL